MKAWGAALAAHYALGTTTLATCWKATLTNGTVVAATSRDRDITFDSVLYLSVAAYTPSDVESGSALAPDNLELEGFLASPHITDSDIHSGIWDFAAIEIFEVNYRDLTMGRNRVREGTLGEVRGGRASFRAELRGLTQAYSRNIVRLIQKECDADLGDARCTVDLAPFTVTSHVREQGDGRTINDPVRTEAADYFTGGLLTFTSGLNDGLSMEVKSYSPGVITLHEIMPFAIADGIANGDTYTLYAGCAKRFVEDCIAKFDNGVNFRGFPHLPGASIYGAPGTTIGSPSPAPPAPPPSPAPPPPPPAPTPPPPAPSGGNNFPFGSKADGPYAAGIRPTQTDTTMNDVLTAHYDAWKAVAVLDAPGISGGKAIHFTSSYLTVSEGMGYGMLLAVLFAGHDPGARTLFDALLTTVRARPAYSVVTYFTPLGAYLMEWRLNTNGTSGGEGWNAMDGDEDIAMALLMADRQWGSAGTWDYLTEGLNTIAAMKAYNFKTDGTSKGLSTANVSRTSDYMFGHFRAYAAATGDSFWSTTVIDRCVYLTDLMQTVHSAGVGLVPDFIINTHTTPIPSTGFMGDGNANEHHYWWNACRNPWRYAADYVLSGDADVKLLTTRLIDFFKAEVDGAAGDVTAIGTGYRISDGFELTGGDSPAYHGPILAGACVDAGYQSFCDALWTWNAAHLTTGYYDGEIQLLSMVVASGNWWTP